MNDLHNIAKRLEEATEADREIDCRLSHHFDRKGISYGSGDDSGWAPAKTVDGWDEAKWSTMRTEHVSSVVPSYTDSIDAALALVERALPGAWYVLAKGRMTAAEPLYGCELLFGADEQLGIDAGPTAPIAIVKALVRALIAKEGR